MTEQITNVSSDIDNAHTVEVFLHALQDQDLATADAQLDDNLIYQNVGFPTVRGRKRTMKLFKGLQRPSFGFEVKIHRIAVNGPVVLTERTDVLRLGPVRLQFWVCGVFEVKDGRITLWRDYFDMYDMTKATVRGLIGAVIPGLRPTL